MLTICDVYKSVQKPEVYIYVARHEGLKRVPAELLENFGEPVLALSFNLAEDRKLAIENEQAKLDGLLKNRDRGFAQLLSLQHQLNALLPYIAEYGATTEVVPHNGDAVKRAQARVEELALKRQVRLEELASLEQAGPPFLVEESRASTWPVNLLSRLASVGFATGAAMGLSLVFFTAVTRLFGSAGVRQRKPWTP